MNVIGSFVFSKWKFPFNSAPPFTLHFFLLRLSYSVYYIYIQLNEKSDFLFLIYISTISVIHMRFYNCVFDYIQLKIRVSMQL